MVVLALVLATGCSFAGAWQYARHVERSHAVDVVVRTYNAAPVPLDDLVPRRGSALPADEVWRPVAVRGTYLPEGTALLRNRPVGGNAGFHVLVPLSVTSGPLSGAVLVVDRGWVGLGDDASSSAPVAAPPPGEVDVVVRLRPAERPRDNTPVPGQVFSVEPRAVAAATGTIDDAALLSAVYGSLAEEVPAPADRLGPLDPPSTDLGSHLSYAFQWWVFAAGALGAFGWLAVKELRSGRAARPGGSAADDAVRDALDAVRAGRAAPRRRRRPSAEDEEDALLDAAHDRTAQDSDTAQDSEMRSR